MQLLHHLAADLDRLRVVAEPDSPAEAVLTLTGLQDLLTRPARPASEEAGPKLGRPASAINAVRRRSH